MKWKGKYKHFLWVGEALSLFHLDQKARRVQGVSWMKHLKLQAKLSFGKMEYQSANMQRKKLVLLACLDSQV